MSRTTYRCVCGLELKYKQDLVKERGAGPPTWKCKDCGSQIPSMVAEKISHQHPS
ncbi:MAG: hypothetical protein ABEI06_10285 [Halobacteriaceae archaeon]